MMASTATPQSAGLGPSDEQRMLVEAVVEMATARDFRGVTNKADYDHKFPFEIWDALCEMELPGLDLPTEIGGQGGGSIDIAYVFEALAAHSIAATTAHFTFSGFGNHVVAGLDESHGLRVLLPGMVAGSVRVALGLTEPSGGSDLSRMRTRLVREGDGWRLQGSKIFTTLAGEATHIFFGCLLEGEGAWRDRFSLAMVPNDTPGMTVNGLEIEALRSTPTYEVGLEGVEVAGGFVVEPPHAFDALMSVLNQERIAVSAQSIGLGRRALEIALAHAETREVSGGLLVAKQTVAHRLVDCWEGLEAARLLVLQAATAVDAGVTSGVLPTMAERKAAEVAFKATDLAVQLHGGGGLERGSEVHRLWRDTRLHLIGPVAREEAADYLFRNMRKSFRLMREAAF
jgi:acyl-CoA dehydrogenase